MTGAVQRHRVVALGSGYGRLTATRTLEHGDHPDVFTFLLRIAGRGTAHVDLHSALWLQVISPAAVVLTAAGALVTLCVTIVRGRNNAAHWQRCEMSTTADYFNCDEHMDPEIRKGWH
jgi:hypothetical protein